MAENLESEQPDSKQRIKQNTNYLGRYIIPGVVSLFVAILTVLFSNQIQKAHERPKIEILGAMPIHLYELQKSNEFGNAKFKSHRLGFIFKAKNNSPTASVVHMTMIEGCVNLDPFVAEQHLPPNERVPDSTNHKKWYEKHASTIQRISASAAVRQDSKLVSEYGYTYIGVLFSFPNQAAYLINPNTINSISLKGDCKEIITSNPHPSIQQVFEDWLVYYESPKDINQGFRNGRIKLSLFVGGDQILVNPESIKKMKSLKLDSWEELLIAQMYENPDTSYSPVRKLLSKPNH